MKKLITLSLAAITSASMLMGCSGGGTLADGSIALKVWTSKEDQAMIQTMAEEFETLNADQTFKFEWAVMGEPDVVAGMSDMDVTADVFSFPGDQLYSMIDMGALYEVQDIGEFKFKTDAIANNTATSIEAGTVDGALYGFPSTEDNTYFLYYDKSVVTHTGNIDEVLADCVANGKQFTIDLSNGFYNASFFFSNGGELARAEDGSQICNFNDPEVGIDAVKAMENIALNEQFITSDDALIKGDTGIGEKMAAAVTGVWNADAIKAKLGDNFGVMKLPDIKIGDTYVPWKSFGGGKYIGVKANTKQPRWAMEFAAYLTNEENQMTKFEERGFVPTNKVVAANETVTSDPVVKAVLDQMAQSVTQINALSGFWTPTEAVGTALEKADYVALTDEAIQEMLDTMVNSMKSI